MARVLLTEVSARKPRPYQVIRHRPLLRDADGACTLPVPAYRQTRNYCCGFTCALMVAHYFETPVSARKLFQDLGTSRDGTRQTAIVRELRALGVRVNVRYDVDFDRVRREIDRGKLIIGYLLDAEHWVVIYGYAREPARLYVADPRPAVGCEMTWEHIAPRLGRFGMVCSSSEVGALERAARPAPAAGQQGDSAGPAQLSFDFGAP